jgi:predicted nucleotidyltransferase
VFQLRKIGRFFPISDSGFIINDCDAAYLDTRLANRVNEFYRELFGEKLHSVYVRGSVARGNFLPGLSDLDTFGVVTIDNVPQAVPDSAKVSAQLVKEFPDFTDIVFVVVSLDKILSDRRNPFTFLLQTQSCCIFGNSLQSQLPPYRPTIEIIGEALYLRQRIDQYFNEIQVIDDPQRIKFHCTVLMKGLVRSAYDLVLPLERRYTRDLYFCYQGFIRHYPDHAEAARQAIEWAIEPIADKQRIASFLSSFGTWLCCAVDELCAKHGLTGAYEESKPAENCEP